MEPKHQLIDEITPIIANNLSESEKQAAILKLQKQESEIRNGIADTESIIHIALFTSEQEIIRRWATRLKQLHYLGAYEKPINTISAHIKWQIGKMSLPLEKKDNLIRNISRSLDEEFKQNSDTGQNVPENTSAFCNTENSFIFAAMTAFKSYHETFVEIADTLLQHLEDRQINKEFCNVLEWEEIAEFCTILAAMQEKIKDAHKDSVNLDKQLAEFSSLNYIKEDLNLRQSSDSFRDAMYVLLGADKSFRKMAHKFGISPRQNQRVRARLDDWPEKDAKRVILEVMGSYLCPCGCGMNLVTSKRHVDLTSDKFFWEIRFKDKKFKIPEKYRQKYNITPIAIAEKVWGKKFKLAVSA